MSNINIQRAVANIRSTTTVYTPVVEMVVNAIQAIEAKKEAHGDVHLRVRRTAQQTLDLDDDEPSRIVDVLITDNGIGFNQANRDSFDTLYSAQKIREGGKGFGRLTCLRYFDDVQIESTYFEERMRYRRFSLGKENELIVDEELGDSDQPTTGTTVALRSVRTDKLGQRLPTIARALVELLLPYFTTAGYACPRVRLSESDGSNEIVLNDYIDSPGAIIHEVGLPLSRFVIDKGSSGPQEFLVRVFRFFSPKNATSKVSLVAHKREVTEVALSNYVPEFSDEFHDGPLDGRNRSRNYILKAYVFGPYLDDNVELERGAFRFGKEDDLYLGIAQTDIERKAAELTQAAVSDQVASRQEKKRERLQNYVEDQAPWYKPLMRDLDITQLSPSATNSEMDSYLHREQYKQEQRISADVAKVLASTDSNELAERARELAAQVSESSKNELVHYVALRRQVLELFKRSLEFVQDEKFSTENAVHNIIFPTRQDSQDIAYERHNLWMLDERLTFTSYLSSDLPINGGTSDRPDVIAFDRPVAFRADNEASNPVTIFEFKRPGRDDFANPSSRDDPIEQIVRYVNALRAGEFKTPVGREMQIADTTPFYGYVVCDLNAKVKKWLRDGKDFKMMPDGLGYFFWRTNINLYIEVLDWSKVLKDAELRNRVFFHKLGIHAP